MKNSMQKRNNQGLSKIISNSITNHCSPNQVITQGAVFSFLKEDQETGKIPPLTITPNQTRDEVRTLLNAIRGVFNEKKGSSLKQEIVNKNFITSE